MPDDLTNPAMTIYVTVNRGTYKIHRMVLGKRKGEIVACAYNWKFRHQVEFDLSKHDSLRGKLVAIFEAAEAEAVKQNLKSKEPPCPTL